MVREVVDCAGIGDSCCARNLQGLLGPGRRAFLEAELSPSVTKPLGFVCEKAEVSRASSTQRLLALQGLNWVRAIGPPRTPHLERESWRNIETCGYQYSRMTSLFWGERFLPLPKVGKLGSLSTESHRLTRPGVRALCFTFSVWGLALFCLLSTQ